MKGSTFLSLFFVACVAFAFYMMAFHPAPAEGDSRFYQHPNGSAVTSDTITNTEKDTLSLPNVLTLWETAILDIETTQLSGTQAIIVVVQKSAKVPTTATWHEHVRDTLTANQDVILSFGPTDAYKYRYIVNGYTGTQSVKYDVKALYKRPTQ